MLHSSPVLTLVFCGSFGTHLLHHLASDAAGLTGGQVTVVTALQVDAGFPGQPAS